MGFKRNEEENGAKINLSVVEKKEVIENLMQVLGESEKASAMRKAFEFTIENYHKLSTLSKMSIKGHLLPEYISPGKARKILDERGIKVSTKTIKRWCGDENHQLKGMKLDPEKEKSHWVVNLDSLLEFIEGKEIDSRPEVVKIE